ncbi:hypothetical protein [Methanoculleus sp.]|jgi:hypothetical protein|uniref:hypothetical protein n=1 Tax=Methanoculleus sp. TaxID=90427 RepID=UPI0025F05F43|nr:hypothetical protein [Methanoculleus sp.]MCK9320348.1 hypothetical protein [Methanoculleus sp.]
MKTTNRFEGKLDRNHGRLLLAFRFNGRQYEVRCTDHSLDRFADHGLSVNGALGAVVALGKNRLDKYALSGSDTAIIDMDYKQTVILTFETEGDYTQIRFATIIPKNQVFIKKGTKIIRLFGRKNHDK